MPLIQPELHLSNSQVGHAGLGAGVELGARRPGYRQAVGCDWANASSILVICALVFSAASVLSGWATSFAMLLATRALMGFAEGGVMPISQALIAAEVDPARRGLGHGGRHRISPPTC